MAVTKAKKSEILEELKEKFKEAKSISFTSNSWLSVEEMSELRKNLREVNASFTLAKKTLIKVAMKDIHGVELSDENMEGQVAVVCSYDDPIAGMSKANEFIKDKKDKKLGEVKITWLGAYFEWELKGEDDTKAIASMPSRETLLGRLVGSMQSPLSSFARFLDAASKKLEEEWKDNLWSIEMKKEEKTEEKAELKEEKQEVTEKEPKEEETKKEEVKEEVKAEADTKEEVKEEKQKEAKTEEKVEEKTEEKAEESKKEEA